MKNKYFYVLGAVSCFVLVLSGCAAQEALNVDKPSFESNISVITENEKSTHYKGLLNGLYNGEGLLMIGSVHNSGKFVSIHNMIVNDGACKIVYTESSKIRSSNKIVNFRVTSCEGNAMPARLEIIERLGGEQIINNHFDGFEMEDIIPENQDQDNDNEVPKDELVSHYFILGK